MRRFNVSGSRCVANDIPDALLLVTWQTRCSGISNPAAVMPCELASRTVASGSGFVAWSLQLGNATKSYQLGSVNHVTCHETEQQSITHDALTFGVYLPTFTSRFCNDPLLYIFVSTWQMSRGCDRMPNRRCLSLAFIGVGEQTGF